MTIALPPDLQKWIEARVDSGEYATPEAVVAAALLCLEQQRELAGLDGDELELIYPGLKEKVATGWQEAISGKLIDGEQLFDELDAADGDREDHASAG